MDRARVEAVTLQRYFLEPYRFVPPFRSTFWLRFARHVMPRQLRRNMQVHRWHFEGVELLRQSLQQGAGILLTPNHSRWADPVVVGMLGLAVRRYFYYVVSYHLFKNDRRLAWWMRRLGGFSILREGADRESLRACSDILASAERPLVLFPEGTWFRQNDRLGPLQDGLALITRQAAKASERPVLVHPVALKYWLLTDPRPALRQRLDTLETNLGWAPQQHLDLLPRIEKLGQALLAVKEIEHLGQPRPGTLDERISQLNETILADIEKSLRGKVHSGWPLERARRLRQRLVADLREKKGDADEARRLRQQLDQLLFCENLTAQSFAYLQERPSLERLTETVQRIEETIADRLEVPVAPLGVVVRVGPAIDVRAVAAQSSGRGAEPLTAEIARSLQGMLDQLLEQGPPPEWNCPPRVEPVSARGVLTTPR